jgi:hypothetical protein
MYAHTRGVFNSNTRRGRSMAKLVDFPLDTKFTPILFWNFERGERAFDILNTNISKFSMIAIEIRETRLDVGLGEQ